MSPIQVNHNISQKNIKPKPSCQLNMKKKVSPSFQTNKRNNKIKSTYLILCRVAPVVEYVIKQNTAGKIPSVKYC